MKCQNLAILFVPIVLCFVSCNNSSSDTADNKTVTIFFDPSHDLTIDKYSIKASLDGNMEIDTLFKNDRINKSHDIGCLFIEEKHKNILLFKVQNKTMRLDLNKYTQHCISLFFQYDNRIIIDSMFQKYQARSIKTRNIIPDYKVYSQRLINLYPKDKFDSLMMNIKYICLCDSD